MKKILILALVLIVFILMLCSCNEDLGPGSYTFTHVHISDSIDHYDATVIKWKNDEVGIEVKTEEYGSLYLSEGTYILFNDKCPICGK